MLLKSPQMKLVVFAPKIQNDYAYILGGMSWVNILIALRTLVYTKASEDFHFIY
jgi:hypothetical protein